MLLIFLDPDVGDPDVVLGSLPSFFFFATYRRGLFWTRNVLVYRQLGNFSLGRGPLGGSASWRKCQLGEVPVRGKCQLGDKGQLGDKI